MAIDIDVQNDKFPYLARQVNGDVVTAFGYGIDHVYEADQEFIDFLSRFSIDNLEGEWLDQLGIIIGLPRPYTTKPILENGFEFDIPAHMLDGTKHGFSTTTPITIDGVQYDRSDGGVLDNIYVEDVQTPISDTLYKKYLYASALLKRTHSIKNIANVLEIFVDTTRFIITFRNTSGFVNDIEITLSATSADYKEALQEAFNYIFKTPPFVLVDVSLYFDDLYTVPEIESIIEEVTGSDTGYTVSYVIEQKKVVFTITLDNSLSQYEDAVKDSVEAHFAGANDVIIVVVVE